MKLVQLVPLVLALVQLAGAQQDIDGRRRRCGQGEATCGDGRCIDYRRLCDGRRDCADGSDEARCGSNRCQPNELQCANGNCVMKHWRCDGDDDCRDGTDEQNCDRSPAGSRCSGSEFQCVDRLQCVPRTFQCDDSPDCQDGSDEAGCAAPVIVEQPPAVRIIRLGDVFVIRCRAVGTPIPEISWRRNWNHVPGKCRQESLEGRGTLTCPDAVATDQGAYSCEAINTRGVMFAIPDTNVVVTNGGLCQPPEFNNAALTNDDCQRCFCFGATTDCASSSLSVSELPAPDPRGFSLRNLDRMRGDIWEVEPLRERPYPGQPGEVQVRPPQLFGTDAYFGLPSSHTGRQLNSYGGYLRFSLSPVPPTDSAPEVVIQGNGVTIWYLADVKPAGGDYTVRILEGNFFIPTRDRRPRVASREQIMMALENVDHFLIRAPSSSRRGAPTVLSSVRLDTAVRSQTPQGPAALVEQCRCPPGYTGQSCEECAPGYERRPGGQWLGTCEPRFEPLVIPEECSPGQYGDPARNIPCRPCPCPGPQQQFGRTCFLDSDDQVTCNCDPGYAGRRCERCAAGFRGQPSQGQPCVQGGECDPAGSLEDDPDPRTGQCSCKEFVTGRRCDRCVPRAFHLSASNQYGCINCFCSGVTDQCSSSQWYRQQELAVFKEDTQDVTLTDDMVEQSFEGLSVDQTNRRLVIKDLQRLGNKPVYWSLPSRFLGDKVTAYGGSLRINMTYSATADLGAYPDYPDVEIIGNDVRLVHLVPDGLAANRPISLEVPLLEQAWRRDDGGPVDREHLLMALADLEYIIFKAVDTRGASEATLSGVELDVATSRFTGQEPAYSVEQCICPLGYRGLSCEDCDVGYTRSLSGLYLRRCVECNCGGRSDECDPETGECVNCREHTAGPDCGVCRRGYEGDPSRGQPCRPSASLVCDCDPRGSRSDTCDARQQCDCKASVEGNHCDRCRPGSFGLGTDPAAGCSRCFCSGVSRQCSVARLYRSQLPMSILEEQHGVTLANREGDTVVDNGDIAFSAADNEVSYSLTASQDDQTLYWALPDLFTGDQLMSYGGTLTIRQRLQIRSRGGGGVGADMQPDIIIYGGAVELRLRTPARPQPDGRAHSYTVQLTPEEGWVDGETGARADRGLLLTALSDVEAILIRATPTFSDGQLDTYLSNVVLDTAIATSTRQDLVETIEQCRCPVEYQGLSCQDCAPGHYRTAGDTCQPCPCNRNEQSCELAENDNVQCTCRPSFSGRWCEIEGDSPGDQRPSGPSRGDQRPSRGDQQPPEQQDTVSPPSPPRVTISPRYLQLEFGQPAELRCEAEGSPAPTVAWTGGRDGVIEADVSIIGGLLVISAVTKAHEAEYACTATNAAGTDTVRTIIYVSGAAAATSPPPTARPDTRRPTPLPYNPPRRRLEAEGRPQVVVYPSPQQTVPVGGSVLMQCRGADDSPRPDVVTWTRADGSSMPATAEVLPGGVVRFIRVTGDEEGDYVCTASNAGGEVIVTASIDIISRPVIRLYQPSTYRVTEGEEVELTCSATGDPAPTVSWSDGGTWTGMRGVPGRVTGTYSPVTLADAGVHKCTATSEAGTTIERLQLVVEPAADGGRPAAPAPRQPEFSAGRPPTFAPAGGSVRTGNEEYVVPLNGRAELSCVVEGASSRVMATWMRSGGRDMPTDHSIRAGILYINGVQKDAEGVYTCLGIGASGVVLFMAEATLRVLVPPRIQLYPVRQVVQPGDSASIRCTASGDEPIRLVWSRVQGRLPDTASIAGGDLIFGDIAESDAGRYICLAENEAGHSEGVAEVVVRRGASIVAFERDVRAYVGSSVTLRCDSSGFDGRISWSRETGLPDSAVSDDSSLTLTRVDDSASGVYLCSVQDQSGRRLQDQIRLTVQPTPPETLTRACHPTTFPCGSGECLPLAYFCDGTRHCIDGSDETQCELQSDQPADPGTAASPRDAEMALDAPAAPSGDAPAKTPPVDPKEGQTNEEEEDEDNE